MIKISIIVPVYNTAKYLKRCLESILIQSLNEIEIIVVNDGSTDESLKILEEYEKKDRRIKIINKKNGGLSSARNAGINLAKGKYIINLDSDDWIEQDYFKNMYEFAEQNSLDIVVSDFFLDFDNGYVRYTTDLNISSKKIISSHEYLKLFFEKNIYPAVWNKMYLRDLYQKNEIRHPIGVSLGEDLATTPLLASFSKKIGKLNKAYVHYIQNMESLTKANPMNKINDLYKAFDILEKALEKKEELYFLKVNSLLSILLFPRYNPKEKRYDLSILNYLYLLKDGNLDNKKLSLKLRVYNKILKTYPKKETFYKIYSFNLIGSLAKNKLKEYTNMLTKF